MLSLLYYLYFLPPIILTLLCIKTNLNHRGSLCVGDPRLTIARSTEGWWAKLVNAGLVFSPPSLTLCTLLIPFWNKYTFPKFSPSSLSLCTLLTPFWNRYFFPKFSPSSLTLCTLLTPFWNKYFPQNFHPPVSSYAHGCWSHFGKNMLSQNFHPSILRFAYCWCHFGKKCPGVKL